MKKTWLILCKIPSGSQVKAGWGISGFSSWKQKSGKQTALLRLSGRWSNAWEQSQSEGFTSVVPGMKLSCSESCYREDLLLSSKGCLRRWKSFVFCTGVAATNPQWALVQQSQMCLPQIARMWHVNEDCCQLYRVWHHFVSAEALFEVGICIWRSFFCLGWVQKATSMKCCCSNQALAWKQNAIQKY